LQGFFIIFLYFFDTLLLRTIAIRGTIDLNISFIGGCMYLKKTKSSKTGRTYLSMVHGYHDKEKGYARTKTIESFGYLDDLEKLYDDPIAHFSAVAEARNQQEQSGQTQFSFSAKKNETLKKNTDGRKNYGYILILMIYYWLGIDRFLLNKQQRESRIEYNASTILKFLLVNRILAPGSKKRAFENKNRYFDFERKDGFKLVDVYRCLSHISKYEEDIQKVVYENISKRYERNTDYLYYDITNYYFEIESEDELRKKGFSKENRRGPIVQMGLAMDADGIPVSYELFPGNESEKLHLRPMVLNLKSKYEIGKVIAVADSAQNTGNNIYYLDQGKQGYVFSQSIAGGSADFKKYVTDPSDYVWNGNEFKKKSRIERREISVDFERNDGTTYKKKVLVDQRQIVFYSEKYAARSRAKREAIIKKAQIIIDNPSAYTKATSHGAMKYIKNIVVDKETGEFKVTKETPYFDIKKLREEEKYDGYYAIVTNLFEEGKDKAKFTDEKIIDIYRDLWKIEDSFKITKKELETRPVYLSREDRIRAHFLTCYIALVVIRLIQKEMDYEYSPAVLIEAMNSISCSNEANNIFLFDYRSDVTDKLGKVFGLDFTRKRMTRKEIKKNISKVKI